MLGREIATLINKEKQAGSYEFQFNTINLPSGLYFYRIESGDPSAGSPKGQAGQEFQQVKKMILMK